MSNKLCSPSYFSYSEIPVKSNDELLKEILSLKDRVDYIERWMAEVRSMTLLYKM